MVECDYCGQSFDGAEAYLRHLRDAHEGELGPIDSRRVEATFGGGDEDATDIGSYVLGGLGLLTVAVVAFVLASAAGVAIPFVGSDEGTPREPGSPGTAHEHGTIEVVIDGNQLDFSKDRFQNRARCFHFERGRGRVWHTHCDGVTLGWALSTLGIDASQTTLTYEGTAYRESEGWNVSITVDGERVNVDEYVLGGAEPLDAAERGDHVRVVVERAE
jgi:hypothetical protein